MFEENMFHGGWQFSQRVWRQAEQRALDQARRVYWKRLAQAADQYTEWHVFTLWLRAVVDAAHGIPEVVATELKIWAPHYLEAVPSKLMTAVQPGTHLWQHMSRWAETNRFLSAKTEGWLDAVHYFSSLSIDR